MTTPESPVTEAAAHDLSAAPPLSVESLRALSEAATPGPWATYAERQAGWQPKWGVRVDPKVAGSDYRRITHAHIDQEGFGNGSSEADAAFIAAAVNYVRAALADWDAAPRGWMCAYPEGDDECDPALCPPVCFVDVQP